MSNFAGLRPVIDPLPLADALAGTTVLDWGGADPQQQVAGVSVDSKDIDLGWIFVAIGGANRHGIEFLSTAVSLGAAVVISDADALDYVEDLPIPLVQVQDPRRTAALIARNLYEPAFQGIKLASVTGTNGKTTTAYFIKAAMTPALGKVGVMGTLEIDVADVALESRRTTSESPVVYRALAVAAHNDRGGVVIEASAHALSLNRLEGLLFDSVVFTNLQHDHLDYYQTMDNYFVAKASLFDPSCAKQGVVCVDDEWGQKLAREAVIPVQTVSALVDSPPHLNGSETHWQVLGARNDAQRWGVTFDLQDPLGQIHSCFCPIPGLVNVQNAAVAVVSAWQMGIPLEQAIEGVATAPPIPGRMEIVPSDESVRPRVLVDYAHTPEALDALLDTVRPLVSRNVVLVFGTDGDRDSTKREELAEIAARKADILWVTDENPRSEDPQFVRDFLLRGIAQVRPDMHDMIEVKTCRRDAVREAIIAAGPGDLVVIIGKGAEREQEIRGVYHAYMDSIVCREVLQGTLPRS